MGKVYVLNEGGRDGIPGWREQGVDILSPGFTREVFERADRAAGATRSGCS